MAHALGERLGDDKVAAHHGSLSRETRLAAESRLKSGAVPVVVATASLELGIDVGHVDLVCHLGAPRALATLLQRVGRSGHYLGAVPKGILFPLTRDDLLQSAAAVRAVLAGGLDRLHITEKPLDILAQQIVATVASEEIGVEELWALVRRAHPFRDLPRRDFDRVLDMLSEGVSTRRGRRSAHLHRDRVHERLRPRRGARLAAITSGGAIPDTADYEVVEDPTGAVVGKVNEDFAVESMAGDIFLLGNRSWRIRRVEAGRVRVVDAAGAAPTIPFWLGEAPARTRELSEAVGDLRREVAERCADAAAAVEWLMAETRVDRGGAEQIVEYIAQTLKALGAMPTLDTIVAERFFDEAGGMQLVLHSPFGGRINRAFGLALRKRFCVSFDFELQAAATDDGIVISLGEQHSFPLDAVFSMVRSHSFEQDLIQAALVAPMFGNRWRWNASRALALLRFSGGRRVPMPIQRMRAEDLLAAVFPAQLACGDNRTGPIEPVDHPLVDETLDNCLHEAMDAEGLRQVLLDLEAGEIRAVAAETAAPSPMSHEILNANPYAFLDDAPLEERRARAVSLRRTDPDLAAGIGALDAEAIAEVRRQAWPDARDADEVHDALLTLGLLPEEDAGEWRPHLDALIADRRAVVAEYRCEDGSAAERRGLVAAERVDLLRAVFPEARFSPEPPVLTKPAGAEAVDAEEAAVAVVRGWMDSIGPATARSLAQRLGLAVARVEAALGRLEADGSVLRGRFTSDPPAGEAQAEEFCERGLLARIHRLTIGRLRKEIEAVSAADFMRFLFRWQHVQPGAQLHGREGVRRVIGQLQGLELPGPAWERDVLRARVAEYAPADLEQLCLAGEVGWGRLAISAGEVSEGEEPAVRRRSAPTRSAPLAFFLRENLPELLQPVPPGGAASRPVADRAPGARLPRAARRVVPGRRRARAEAPAGGDRGRSLGAGGVGAGHRRRHRRAAHPAAAREGAPPAPRRQAPAGAAGRSGPAARPGGALVAAAGSARGGCGPCAAARAHRAPPAGALGRGVPRGVRAREAPAAVAEPLAGAAPHGGARRGARRPLRRRVRRRAVRAAGGGRRPAHDAAPARRRGAGHGRGRRPAQPRRHRHAGGARLSVLRPGDRLPRRRSGRGRRARDRAEPPAAERGAGVRRTCSASVCSAAPAPAPIPAT